jgi:hypothetical protein
MLKNFVVCALATSACLAASGCVVHEYHANPYAGKPQKVTGANYVIHASSNQNLCLDVQGDKAAANQGVGLFTCHGKENQRFTFVDQPQGTSSITTIGNLCIDVHGGGVADGTPVDVFPCGNDQPNQVFRHFEDGRIHEVHSQKCLTANPVAQGTRLALYTCDTANDAQVWVLTQ